MDKGFPGHRIHPVYQQRVKTYFAHHGTQPLEVEVIQPSTSSFSASVNAAPSSATLRKKQQQVQTNTYGGVHRGAPPVKSDSASFSMKLAIGSGALYADSC